MTSSKTSKEKYVVLSITLVFLIIIFLLSFTPRLLAESNETEDEDLLNKLLQLQQTLQFIQDYYVDEEKVTTDQLMEGAMKGMFDSLGDPHSMYLSEKEMKDMQETTTGKFGGVGLFIYKDEEGTEVSRPIPGTPAYKAGVLAGDLIIAVNGENIVGMEIDDVVDRLKGVPGTEVTMTIRRGKTRVFDITVVRDNIELPTVTRDMILKDIAYLHIIQFTPLTDERVIEALDYFKKNNYKALIIDLRSNPGGLLDSVVKVADHFFEPGQLLVGTKSRIPEEEIEFYSQKKKLVSDDIPIVILTDQFSASASEILTGALKDTGRAYVIGQNSYGKGSVQQIRGIGGAGFRLTIAKYYTPNKIFIDGKGIAPDKEIKEATLTDEEEASLQRFLDKNKITQFLEDNPAPSEKDINVFLKQIKQEGYTIQDRYIRKLIRNEINRTNNDPPVYDLDFDLELQEAVYYIRHYKGEAQ
ncbi:MAG: S41 family peptidase [Spirochaetales bacterium]|nr:S41 family peptidase [Spirochaetales bacterium]